MKLHRIVAVLLALAPCVGMQESARGWRKGSAQLAGPLEEVVLREPGGASTILSTSMGPGAHVRLDVPLSAAPPELVQRVTIATRPETGRCELALPEDADWDAPWLALPAGLRARTRPPVTGSASTPTIIEASVLGAALLAGLALQRRALAALAVALGGAGLLALLPDEAREPPAAAVLEGDAASGRWLLVVARADELELPATGPLRLEVDPGATVLTFRVELRPSQPERWLARAPGARLVRVDELAPPVEELARERNDLLDLSACWVRAADGSWTEHGAWPRGEALPASRGSGAPPGWLASGLPQGLGVLIGRAAPGAAVSTWRTEEEGVAGVVWLRHVGF